MFRLTQRYGKAIGLYIVRAVMLKGKNALLEMDETTMMIWLLVCLILIGPTQYLYVNAINLREFVLLYRCYGLTGATH